MTRLIKGKDLSKKQLQEVKSAFVHRWFVIGEGRKYLTEQDWINDHAFYITILGHLAHKPFYCEPVYMADINLA